MRTDEHVTWTVLSGSSGAVTQGEAGLRATAVLSERRCRGSPSEEGRLSTDS